jgi:hypothetical protein
MADEQQVRGELEQLREDVRELASELEFWVKRQIDLLNILQSLLQLLTPARVQANNSGR